MSSVPAQSFFKAETKAPKKSVGGSLYLSVMLIVMVGVAIQYTSRSSEPIVTELITPETSEPIYSADLPLDVFLHGELDLIEELAPIQFALQHHDLFAEFRIYHAVSSKEEANASLRLIDLLQEKIHKLSFDPRHFWVSTDPEARQGGLRITLFKKRMLNEYR